MRLLPCGDDAILVELDEAGQRRGLEAVLSRGTVAGVVEHVAAARTVLVRVGEGQVAQVAAWLRGLDLAMLEAGGGSGVLDGADEVVIPVTYDGPDLAQVADLLSVGADEVIARHTGQRWRVDFTGFAAGFGYLAATLPGFDLAVPRRASPRTRVPAGAVGLAGEYSGVYPSNSSGGWQLIGHTETPMWRPERPDPALLVPGRLVRFEAHR